MAATRCVAMLASMTTTSRSLAAVLLAAAVALPAAATTAAGAPETPAAHIAAARRAGRRSAPRRGPVRVPARRPATRARSRRRPAKPRDKQLGLTATPDPLAPADRTPKVLFDVRNAVRGRSYRIMAEHVRGQPQYAPGNDDTPQCTIAVGSTTPHRSPVDGDFPWGRTPADYSDPSDGYDAIAGTPCTGVWEGEMEEIGGRGRSLEFVMEIPSMTIDVVRRYG